MKKGILILTCLILTMIFAININSTNNDFVNKNNENGVYISQNNNFYDENDTFNTINDNEYQYDINNKSEQSNNIFKKSNNISVKKITIKNNYFVILLFLSIISILMIISYVINLKYKKIINGQN